MYFWKEKKKLKLNHVHNHHFLPIFFTIIFLFSSNPRNVPFFLKNRTSSTLVFIASRYDQNRDFSCMGTNQVLKDTNEVPLLEVTSLKVLCKYFPLLPLLLHLNLSYYIRTSRRRHSDCWVNYIISGEEIKLNQQKRDAVIVSLFIHWSVSFPSPPPL